MDSGKQFPSIPKNSPMQIEFLEEIEINELDLNKEIDY